MSNHDLKFFALKGLKKFADVLFDLYELKPTDNLMEYLLSRTDHVICFFNVEPAHEVTVPSHYDKTDEPGVVHYVPVSVKKYPEKTVPFMWAAHIDGVWYVTKIDGSNLKTQRVDHNLWLWVFNQWSARPGYVDLCKNQNGSWYKNSEGTK